MHRLTTGATTTKHLQQLLVKFPNHKWKNEMVEEIKKEEKCQQSGKEVND